MRAYKMDARQFIGGRRSQDVIAHTGERERIKREHKEFEREEGLKEV